MTTQQLELIQTMPKLERMSIRETPAYRVALDPTMCSARELIAAIIGTPTQVEAADELLNKYPTLCALNNARIDEISAIKGIGTQTATRIKAALALAAKLMHDATPEKPAINSPADAANLIMYEMSGYEQEHLKIFVMDRRNRVMEIAEIYIGSVSSAQIRIAEVLRPAIRAQASAVIIAHNHPSGDPTPSPDDVAVTRAINQAGKLFDIDVLDHIVIGNNKFVSLKERGLGFS